MLEQFCQQLPKNSFFRNNIRRKRTISTCSLRWGSAQNSEELLKVAETNLNNMHWSLAQCLTHHTSNGCNARPGDLMASGTISGPAPSSFGSLLELTWRGTKPIEFEDGQQRRFLEDGDTVTMTGWCQADGYRVGFGEVSGQILPAIVTA